MEYGNNKTKDRISNERELDEGKTASQTDGWVVQEKKHNLNWLSDVKRRGWLSLELARDFAEYCGCIMV